MKILFCRHGESEDDIIDVYGGWSDYSLTSTGMDQVYLRADIIQKMGLKFEHIYCSPLKRTYESAQLLSHLLNLPFTAFPYLMARNSYGILTNMKKADAAVEYPDQVKLLERFDNVDGSEPVYAFHKRVQKSIHMLLEKEHESIIVMTHGKNIEHIMSHFFKKNVTQKNDAGIVLVEFTDESHAILLNDGIHYA